MPPLRAETRRRPSNPGFSYAASGMVARGDIQELDVEIDLATGAVQAAED